MNRFLIFLTVLAFALSADAQFSRLGENVHYGGSVRVTAGGGDNAPLWFSANRFGLGAVENNTVLTRAYVRRDTQSDSLRNWKFGYGLDLAAGYGNQSSFNVQQAYVDAGWRMLNLSVGQKERVSELKNAMLSTGGLVLGHNARPLPQVRIELPEFWRVPGTKGFLALKAHLAFGLYMDNSFQRGWTAGTDNTYTRNSFFHSKALFLKVGNHERFPLELSLGCEMACQFGGRGFNVKGYRGEDIGQDVALGGSVLSALIPGVGGDVSDDVFTNAAGNHIGSYHVRLDWLAGSWSIGAYMEHMFEDESQMFMQYGAWKDMLLGVEVKLPANRFVSSLLYEHNGTMDQSGPLFHDATPENPLQISADDAYYNNAIYGSWQHGGFLIGNPTVMSPMYNAFLGNPGSLNVFHNRVSAHHVGLSGRPCAELDWRVLYTHERCLGSHSRPVKDPLTGDFLLVETSYRPKWRRELGFTLAYGHNGGDLLGSGNGAMLTVSWNGCN